MRAAVVMVRSQRWKLEKAKGGEENAGRNEYDVVMKGVLTCARPESGVAA